MDALYQDDRLQAICEGRHDGALFQIGHPNGYVQVATMTCGAFLRPISESLIDAMVEQHTFYGALTIPGVFIRLTLNRSVVSDRTQ